MQDELPARARAATAPTVSRLALASFVLGLLAWPLMCLSEGVIGMVAVMLGMVALDRIRASAGALRGKAFAWTGIGTGLASVLLLLAMLLVFQRVQRQWNLELDASVRATFAAAQAEGDDGALGNWSPPAGSALDAREIRAFAEDVRNRYGAFQALLVSDESASPDLFSGKHSVTLQVDFEFDGGRRPGVVRTVLTPVNDSLVPRMRLEGIVIEDSAAPGGRLELPVPSDRGRREGEHP